jgi:hypothetical protein
LGDQRSCSELIEYNELIEHNEFSIVDHCFCCKSGCKLISYCLCSKIMTVSDKIHAPIVRMCEGGMKDTNIADIIGVPMRIV